MNLFLYGLQLYKKHTNLWFMNISFWDETSVGTKEKNVSLFMTKTLNKQ